MKPRLVPPLLSYPWIVILAISAIFYALSLNYYYFGRFNDDARHFLAAKSLLQGRYVNLAHPDAPPLINQLPGYPLLLMPAAAADSPNLAKWMNVGMLLGSLFLLSSLLQETASGLPAVVLTALHPLSVTQAGTVMTEVPYLFFSLCAVLYCMRLLQRSKRLKLSSVTALATACAWCGWIHPQGAVLLLAVFLTLFEDRLSRKWSWVFLMMGGALLAAPYLRNLWISGTPASYFQELPSANRGILGQASAMSEVVLANLSRYASLLSDEGMLSWTYPLYGAGSFVARGVGLALLIFVALGMRHAMKAGHPGRIIGIYVIAYLGLHLFWVNQFFRYVFPVLPFLYWFFFQSPIFSSYPRWKTPVFASLAILFISLDATVVINAHIRQPGDNAPPQNVIEWIRTNVPQDTVLASSLDETFYYYTGRKCIQPMNLQDPDDWFHNLVARHVRYFIDYHDLEAMPSVPSRRLVIENALRLAADQLKNPSRFLLAYQPADEPFSVYTLIRPDLFEKGYRLLQDAKEAIAEGHLDSAYQKLKQAETTKASLVRLPFYLGTTALLMGKKQEARKYLRQAMSLEPAFLPAQRNMAGLNP